LTGVGIQADRYWTRPEIRTPAAKQKWPDFKKPFSEIWVRISPTPRRVKIRQSGEMLVDVLPGYKLLSSKPENALERVPQHPGRQNVS